MGTPYVHVNLCWLQVYATCPCSYYEKDLYLPYLQKERPYHLVHTNIGYDTTCWEA